LNPSIVSRDRYNAPSVWGNMKRKILLLIMLTVLLPTSCQQRPAQLELTQTALSPAPVQPSPLAPVSLETATRTVVATLIHTATATQTAAPTHTETPTFTATPPYPPETRLDRQCVKLLPALPEDFRSSGKVILDAVQPIFLDMKTRETIQIGKENEVDTSFTVSPNLAHAAFLSVVRNEEGEFTEEKLFIANALGQRQQEFTQGPQWTTILGWSPDNRLVISWSDLVHPIGNHQVQYSYLLLDSSSGQSEMLRVTLPEVIPTLIKVGWSQSSWAWFATMLNPQRTHLIYPRLLDEEYFTYALWDVKKQKPVVTLESIYQEAVSMSARAPTPLWSPDGTQFIFQGNRLVSENGKEYADFELYKAGLDGQIEQLTNLTPAVSLWDAVYSWSPDGQRIALAWWSENENHIGVLDLKTLAITEYCIPFSSITSAPLWSPDGKQFLITDDDAVNHTKVILVDAESGLAARIAEDVWPVGWLVDTP